MKYPETRRVDHVDEYFGVKVADPYRWLEADVRESAEVAEWVKRQNEVASKYLDAIPQRQRSKSGSPSCGTTSAIRRRCKRAASIST